jgi:hypothetical protein
LNELGDDSFDVNFYKGKIASARFYVLNEVPNIFSVKQALESSDSSAIDLKPEYLG